MRCRKPVRQAVVWMTAAALLLPLRPLSAVGPGDLPTRSGEAPSLIRDAALSRDGTLSGTVVTGNGVADAGCEVLARAADGKLQSTVTDDRGRFMFQNLRGGSYRLGVNGSATLWRVWTSDAAPPIAASAVLLVSDGQVARGQRPASALLTDHPLLPALFLAAVIAIPLAVHSSQDQPAGS